MASAKTASRPKARRSYGDEFKAKVMAECEQPGASVAKVAMSHDINDNVVHRWRPLAREGRRPVAAPRTEFVPVALTAPGSSLGGSGNDIRVDIRRGVTAITVSWPVSAAAECAAWMRDWLK